MLDIKTCQSMSSLLEQLTTTGKDILDTKLLKDFLIQAGGSEEYLKVCHQKVMQQLERDHSEIRYGTLLVIEQLFKRSKPYRELLLDDIEPFLELTVETNFNKLLPKPYPVARKLKRKTLQLIQSWNSEFGNQHRQLLTTYLNLKTKLKIDFDDALKRTNAEVESARRKEERQLKINESKVEVLKAEINENSEEISKVVTEMDNCFALLIPKPHDLFSLTEMKESNCRGGTEETSEEDDSVNLREHGLGLTRSNVVVTVPHNTMNTVKRTEDNHIIFDNLKELYTVLKKRFLTKLRTWLRFITKADNTDLFKRILDLKQLVEAQINRYDKLRIESGFENQESDSDTNESDFEDVPEKEDYEEFVKPPPMRPTSPLPSTSQNCDKSLKVPESSSWSLWGPVDNDPEDPTTLRARIQSVEKNSSDHTNSTDAPTSTVQDDQKPSTSKVLFETESKSSNELNRKEKLLKQAPKLPYDIDLYHWEDEKLTAPAVELVDSDSHRFWTPSDREGEVIEAAEGVSALRTRTIEFTGTFEPVKWACRAPLKNGKLCPRRDRVKCPFHGKVVGRDKFGNPTNPEDVVKEAERQAQEEVNTPPEWQDPAFLRDLQGQIGIDLTLKPPKKGRKKNTFSETYPGLTDIAKEKKTSRARLARKVFNKNAMKRVGQAMDEIDHKKHKDKFGDQYNYAYNE